MGPRKVIDFQFVQFVQLFLIIRLEVMTSNPLHVGTETFLREKSSFQ